MVYDIFTQKDPADLHSNNVTLIPLYYLSSAMMNVDTDHSSSSGNSNISYYHARAAAQVYSTARSVFPAWTTSYFLPDPESPSHSPASSSNQDSPALLPSASIADHSLQERFVAFDVLRGRDVLVKANACRFSIFNVGDRAAELEELCGYSYFDEVIYVKVFPFPIWSHS